MDILNKKGFTLAEVLIAIGVISLGIFAMIALIMVIIKGNAQSRNITIGTNLAQEKMEIILNTSYGSITTANAVIGTYTTFTDERSSHSLMVAIYHDIPASKMKTASVTAYWSPGTVTSSHKVEFVSIIGQ